jgi:hypothetical protein
MVQSDASESVVHSDAGELPNLCLQGCVQRIL